MGLYHGWDNDPDQHADYIRGGVDVDDFDKEVNYQKSLKKKNKRKRYIQRRPGCPDNNNKKHIFVWTTERENAKSIFYTFFGFHKYQHEVCVACGFVGKSDLSDKYRAKKDREWEKLNAPVKGEPLARRRWRSGMVSYRYFCWENDDAEYIAYRRDYINRHDWNSAVFDYYDW